MRFMASAPNVQHGHQQAAVASAVPRAGRAGAWSEPAPVTCRCCGGGQLRLLGEHVTETVEVILCNWKVIQYSSALSFAIDLLDKTRGENHDFVHDEPRRGRS
jgi:hypothetical protein